MITKLKIKDIIKIENKIFQIIKEKDINSFGEIKEVYILKEIKRGFKNGKNRF